MMLARYDAKQPADPFFRTVTPSEYRAVPELPFVPESKKVRKPRTERELALIQIHERAAEFYANCLESKVGAEAKEYLESRGVAAESTSDWTLGYAPKGSRLHKHLEGEFSEELLEASGLFTKLKDGRVLDRFYDRLMFPIRDEDGYIVAFGGRLVGENSDQKGKYLNSIGTEIYDKSQVLYGLDKARRYGEWALG